MYAYGEKENKEKQSWEIGFVNHIYNIGDGKYKVEASVQRADGTLRCPVPTINSFNGDPIPNEMPSDPNYKMSKYIVQRDPRLDGLPDMLIKHWRCLKYHAGGIVDDKDISGQDIIGESLLGTDPNSPTTIRNLLRALMADKKVKEIIKVATKRDECSVQDALAYFIGQLCGIELSECSASKEIDPHGLLDKIGDNDNVECSLSQVFLVSAMSVRTRKEKKFDPNSQLFDFRGRAVFSDPERLKVRLSRLKTALAAIHSSQKDNPSISGPAFALLSHGIRLLIDMRGVSDRLLDKLADEGICRPARVLRYWIQQLASAIDPINPRCPPPEGMCHVLCNIADNADFHIFERCVSVVPIGNLLMGIESEEDNTYFKKHYMKGLGKVSEIKVEDLEPTKEEDDFAQGVLDNQNILALLTVALDNEWMAGSSSSNDSQSMQRPTIGSKVSFTYRSEKRVGTVKATSSKDATIEFVDGARPVSKLISIEHIETIDPTAEPQVTSTVEKDTNKPSPARVQSTQKLHGKFFSKSKSFMMNKPTMFPRKSHR